MGEFGTEVIRICEEARFENRRDGIDLDLIIGPPEIAKPLQDPVTAMKLEIVSIHRHAANNRVPINHLSTADWIAENPRHAGLPMQAETNPLAALPWDLMKSSVLRTP